MTTALLERATARGATALRARRRWRPSPYFVFGGLFWLVMSLAYWRVPMCCDFGQHAAVVERLKANLLHPRHPMADLPGAGSPYYSPYALTQGVLAKLTDLPGWEVVKLSGPVNLLVLLTGIAHFVRSLTPRPWAPVLALTFMTVLWGTHMAWWSGYLGLMSMTGNAAYPSTFAIGLGFWAWGWAARLDQGSRLRSYAGLGALTGTIVLIHPISSVAAVIGVLAFALATGSTGFGQASPARPGCGRGAESLGEEPRVGEGWRAWGWVGTARRFRVPLGWAFSSLAAACVAATWPYFDVFSLVDDQSVDAIHRQLYTDMPERFWLALAGAPPLWKRWRRNPRDPLALMFTLDVAVIIYGWLTGHYTYGRILGLTLIPLQFALAIAIAAPRPWTYPRHALAVTAAFAAALGFGTIQAGAVVPRSLDPVGFDQPPRWPTYEWAAQRIARGDVVLTDGYRPTRSLPAYGPNLVAPAWPDPSLDETARLRRLSDVRAYLAPSSTRARRTEIARRYHVRWLLLAPGQRVPPEGVVVAWSPRTGEVLARVNAGTRRSR